MSGLQISGHAMLRRSFSEQEVVQLQKMSKEQVAKKYSSITNKIMDIVCGTQKAAAAQFLHTLYTSTDIEALDDAQWRLNTLCSQDHNYFTKTPEKVAGRQHFNYYFTPKKTGAEPTLIRSQVPQHTTSTVEVSRSTDVFEGIYLDKSIEPDTAIPDILQQIDQQLQRPKYQDQTSQVHLQNLRQNLQLLSSSKIDLVSAKQHACDLNHRFEQVGDSTRCICVEDPDSKTVKFTLFNDATGRDGQLLKGLVKTSQGVVYLNTKVIEDNQKCNLDSQDTDLAFRTEQLKNGGVLLCKFNGVALKATSDRTFG